MTDGQRNGRSQYHHHLKKVGITRCQLGKYNHVTILANCIIQNNISRVERKTDVSQMVVFPQT